MSSSEKLGDKLEELDLTPDEIHRLTEAMKKKEFRDLLAEYAKEIQDPENKKRYEEEIKLMESERGVDVKFVTPSPGYVIKTVQNGDTKCFVNICYSNTIDKATCTKSPAKKGEHWSIPYSTAAGREDVDKAGGKCVVYDCVFHEETFQRALRDSRFKKLIHDTALQGIESQLNVTLDKVNLKFPKLKFKGMIQPTMIRRKKEDASTAATTGVETGSGDVKSISATPGTSQKGEAGSIEDKLKFPYPYPVPGQEDKDAKSANSVGTNRRRDQKGSNGVKCPVEDVVECNGKQYTVPHYSIVHRGYSDMQSCVELSDSKLHATRPRELVVHITLPLLSSAKTVSLDVLKKQLLLHCDTPAAYKLDIPLPYPVEEERGSARFDKTKKKLIVTLPVEPPITSSPVSIPIEDQTSALPGDASSMKQSGRALVQEIDPPVALEQDGNEKSPTESVDEASAPEGASLDELPEADQAVRAQGKGQSKQEKENAKAAKKAEREKEYLKYFEDWPSAELKIPPELERRLDAIPDDWFKSSNAKAFKQSKNLKTFPVDPFLYEVDIPKYRFTQRMNTITMIIQEQRICKTLLEVKPFKHDDGLHIRLCSESQDDEKKWYYIYVEFDTSTHCSIERSSIKTDVNELNCVILMDKSEEARKTWPFVKIGPCKDTLSVAYLDPEVELEKLSKDLFVNYHSHHLPMHVADPICTPEKMSLTLKPGTDPREDNESFVSSGETTKVPQKYSKTAEEISALIQSGKLDEAIAKEIEMEQEKELDDMMMSKDDVSTLSSQFDQDIARAQNLSETIDECRRVVSEKYFPKQKEDIFDDDRFLLNKLTSESAKSAQEELKEYGEESDVSRKTSLSKSDLCLDLNIGHDADSEKKREDEEEDSSPRDSSQTEGNLKQNGKTNSGSNSKSSKQESKAAKKKRQKQQKNARARLLSHSSDDEQTRVNTYQNIELCKSANLDTNSSTKRGSYDSSSNTSPAPSPRAEDENGQERAFVGSYSYGGGAMSTDDAYDHSSSTAARPIIKRSCKSCAEQDDSDTEQGSMRKSVSFCEDVDVVQIKTLTTKSARKSTRKMKRRDRKRQNGNGTGLDANNSDEEREREDQQQIEVKEQATWNKVPLSTVPLTFDLD